MSDINPPCGHPISPVVISLQDLQSSRAPEQSACTVTAEGLNEDPENSLSKCLPVQDAEESECAFGEDNTSVTEDALCEHLKTHEVKPVQKCLRKSATFPSPNEKIHCDASSEENFEGALEVNSTEESKHPVYSRACSLPTPLKLVSAMKGTREKQGLSLQKQTVTWDPDVYDPTPTIISHTVVQGKKQQRSKNKKNGKNKQKGSNSSRGSRGSSGKDKKQLTKIVRSPGCYKIPDAHEKLVSGDYADGLDDFDVRKPDSYCASSFFEKSLTKLHLEAAAL